MYFFVEFFMLNNSFDEWNLYVSFLFPFSIMKVGKVLYYSVADVNIIIKLTII